MKGCVLQPSSEAGRTPPVTSKLSREEESFVSELQKTYRVDNKSKIMRALELLRSLDQSVLEALSRLDVAVIRRSMEGNAEAQRSGERVLRRLTEFVKTSGKTSPSSGKTPVSSGKSPASLVPSRSVPEKRRSDDVSFRSAQPPQKMPRVSESSWGRGGRGFQHHEGPPDRPSVRPMFDRPRYMDEPRPREWMGPPGRGDMMRREYPMSGYRPQPQPRPPPRGRYGHGPYY